MEFRGIVLTREEGFAFGFVYDDPRNSTQVVQDVVVSLHGISSRSNTRTDSPLYMCDRSRQSRSGKKRHVVYRGVVSTEMRECMRCSIQQIAS